MQVEILLKEVRKEKNYTLQQLSKKSGISTTHINDIENKIKEPSFSMMVRLAKALNVPLDKLYRVIRQNGKDGTKENGEIKTRT